MKFNLANKQPITVNIEGMDYHLKRFTRGDWCAWAGEIDGKRVSEATDGLPPLERARLLLIYSVEPVGNAELSRRLYTQEGTGRIIRTCADRSGVPKEVVDKLLDGGDAKDLETLAIMLGSIVDPSDIKPPPGATGESADPLKSSANA